MCSDYWSKIRLVDLEAFLFEFDMLNVYTTLILTNQSVSFCELCDFAVLYIGVLLWILFNLITITRGAYKRTDMMCGNIKEFEI